MSLQIQIGADVSGIEQAIDQATNSINKIKPAAANGAASLNALGQVARDAPFGFIAIQNNLPILFDQFGALTKASGGLGGALKNLGATFLGPAGITFAIGGAISAITVLVQKYGSLGGALEAIFSKQSQYNEQILESTKSLEKFNKEKRTGIDISNQEAASVQGTIVRVESLGKIVTDVTKSYNERNSALNALKDIDKDHFGNLDIEKTKFSDLKIAVDNYTNSIKQAAITKGFEAAIGQTSVELAKQFKLLNNLKDELEEAKRAPVKFIGKADQVDTRDIDAATERFNKQNSVVNALRGEIALYNTEIDKSVQLQNAIQAPIDAANKKIEEQKKATENAKKIAEKANKIAQQKLKLQQEQLRVDNLYNAKQRISDQAKLNKEELNGIRNTTKERRKSEREIGINIPKQLPTTIPGLNNEELILKSKQAVNELDRLKKAADLTAAYNLISSTFFSPLENLFTNFIETGKFAFKEFGQAVLKAINQIIAKVIATGIITLLASLFIPGFAAAGGGIGASLLKGITGALGFGGGGFGGAGGSRVGQPNFGGVSAGGLQMAGAVNLSLRGSDLVGAINRTNATINRVG